jgi:hypothetical protein
MQSIEAPNQFEIGLDSMSSILSKIALGTNDGNSFLNIIEKDIFNFKENVEISLVKLFDYTSKKYDALKKLVFSSELLNHQIDDLISIISNKNNVTKEKLSENDLLNDLSNSINERNNIILEELVKNNEITDKNLNEIFKKQKDNKIENKKKPDNFLKIIAGNTTKILKKIESSKEKEGNEKPVKFSNIFSTIKDFASSLIIIKKELTDKLVSRINKFGEAYIKFTDVDKKKNKAFQEGITNFSDVISKLGKTIIKPTYALGFLAISMLAISMLAISPMFALGVASIGGLIFVLSKLSANKEMSPNMDKFGLGIMFIVGAMLLMQYVPWEAGVGMIAFIGALNLALRGFSGVSGVGGSSKTDSYKNNPMIMFGLGISVLVGAMLLMQFVPWQAGVGMIAFIGGLNLALRGFNGTKKTGGDLKSNPMVMFALGIGILTLALFAMNKVELGSIFKMILFVGGLGMVMSLFNFDKSGAKNSMVGFAFGIGLMVLAVLAIGEIDNDVLFKGILFIGALGLVMKLFNFDKMGPKNAMISFAFGFGIMVLAMYAMNELPWEALGKTLLFLGGLGLVMKLFGPIQGLQFLALAGGIAVIAGALWLFKKTDLILKDALLFGGVLVGLAGIVALIGIPAVAALIGLGTIALIGMSIGLLIAAGPLALISNINFNPDNILKFMLSAGILSLGFAAITPFAAIGLLGALTFIPIGTSALLGSLSLWAISNMKFDTDKITSFILSAGILSAGFAGISLIAIPGAIGAALFIPIAFSALIGAKALSLISSITINSDKINSFGLGAKSLIDNIDSLGGFGLIKTSAKSLLLIPIFTTVWLASKILQYISENTIDNTKILTFGNTIGLFTSTIAQVLSDNEKKLEDSKPGIEALSKLMNISGSIAKTIQLMANMQFYEYGVQNGKLVLKGVRKLTNDDFLRVGQNLGTMLKCLIDPLLILGSDKSEFIIGGIKITNPFKSGIAQKGIEMLGDLGNAFQPLANSVKTYASIPMVSNPKLLSMFTRSLFVLTNTFSWMFTKISNFDNDLISSSIDNIIKFNDAFKNADTKQITDLNNIFEKFLNNLSDQVKWKKIQNNLAIIKNQFGDIAKNINSIDIEKATAFERNIKNLITSNNSEQLKQAVIALTDLLGMVQNNQKDNQTNNTNNTNNPFTNGINNVFGTNINKEKETKTKTKNKEDNNDNEIITTAINSLQSAINLLSGKLDKTLSVKIVGANSNSI